MPDKLWKPMLAAKPDPEEMDAVLAALPYPALFSPKLDGIRATVQNGRLYSRSLKLIPNKAMQALWGRRDLNGLDGELVVGPPTALDCFNRSTSVVMSGSKPATDAVFYVFDKYGSDAFNLRLVYAYDAQDCDPYVGSNRIVHVTHEELDSYKAFLKYEAEKLKEGYEGVMRRSIDGAYKQGRSTLKEGGLVAVKRTVDAEALVLATYEQEENTNEQKVNELGRMKRSGHKAGKVGKGTLGGFTVALAKSFGGRTDYDFDNAKQTWLANPKDPRFFNIGTGVGLTDAVRQALWARQPKLTGKIVKFRYQKIGTMVSPRQPIFLGFRDGRDA